MNSGSDERFSDQPAIASGQLRALQEQTARVAVGPAVREYLVSLAHATRSHRRVTLGLSPRGRLIWQRVAQARAVLSHRDFVIPDDVQDVASAVLEVRLGIEPEAHKHVLSEIMSSVPVPVYSLKAAPGAASIRHASVS